MEAPPSAAKALLEGVRHVVAVASGKGGVGKSTVAVNLAVSLSLEGLRAGLLDADFYGPNLPQMMGLSGYLPRVDDAGKIEAPLVHGVRLMSMGFLTDSDTPIIWRGPLLHGAVTQMLRDVRWGELDVLVVDLPPGTGDVQISLCQLARVSGALIVTTPQSVALSDVRRAAAMFRKVNVPMFGVVENMGEFVCPHCRKGSRIFAGDGGRTLAAKYGIPFLGTVPLDPLICAGGESGRPVCLEQPETEAARVFREMARKVAGCLLDESVVKQGG